MLEINHVSKTIKGVQIIDGITMKMDYGEVVGLQGINGSGKTMLMRLITGLIFATDGEIVIDGKVLGKDISFPDSVGLLIENPAFLDNYSGFQNLKMLASIKGEIGDETIRETINRVGLNPDDKKKYKKYSLGMKQRLGIAAAIMERPRMLVLDEPTNALDAEGVELLKKIVREEKERGALVILSCHDLNILKEMSERVYHIESGKLCGEV